MRYTSLPQGELVRNAILAYWAQMSGRENVATQHNSPNLLWRILVSSDDTGSPRPPHNPGGAGSNSRFSVESSRVNVAEKSFAWAKTMLMRTKGFSWTFSLPDHFSEKRRTFNGKSGPPQPGIPSMCVAMAPTAPPDFRKTKKAARIKRRRLKSEANSGR